MTRVDDPKCLFTFVPQATGNIGCPPVRMQLTPTGGRFSPRRIVNYNVDMVNGVLAATGGSSLATRYFRLGSSTPPGAARLEHDPRRDLRRTALLREPAGTFVVYLVLCTRIAYLASAAPPTRAGCGHFGLMAGGSE